MRKKHQDPKLMSSSSKRYANNVFLNLFPILKGSVFRPHIVCYLYWSKNFFFWLQWISILFIWHSTNLAHHSKEPQAYNQQKIRIKHKIKSFMFFGWLLKYVLILWHDIEQTQWNKVFLHSWTWPEHTTNLTSWMHSRVECVLSFYLTFGDRTFGVCSLKPTVYPQTQYSIYQVDFVSFLGLVMSLVSK